MTESNTRRKRNDRGNPRRIATRCPHCDTIARVQAKKVVTRTFDELYFQCSNLFCGHSWKASLSFVHTISPSAAPREELGLAVYRGRPVHLPAPANDPLIPNIPPAANDDSAMTETG